VFVADGKRLSLEELWNCVPAEYQHRLQDHKWATLTQQVAHVDFFLIIIFFFFYS
jgi:hypothetical protein